MSWYRYFLPLGPRDVVDSIVRIVAIGICVSACAPALPPPSRELPTPPPLPPAAEPVAPPSKLSYGMVTTQVKRGVTTKAEVLELFGGPNISTADKAGVETWVYERTSTESISSSTDAGRATAQSLQYFFGGGAAQAEAAHRSAGATTTSIRSITVVVKFGGDDRVVDYAVRASQF